MFKNILNITLLAFGLSTVASCSHLPNKFIYPTDEPVEKRPTTRPAPEETNPLHKDKDEKPEVKPETKADAKTEVKSESKPEKAVKINGLPEGSLTHTFNKTYDRAWEKAFETMLSLPLVSSDKAGGTILTDWIVDPKSQKSDELPVFGQGPTLVRFRYAVKITDRNGSTELLLVQIAQKSATHVWVERAPVKDMTDKLMDKLISNIGE